MNKQTKTRKNPHFCEKKKQKKKLDWFRFGCGNKHKQTNNKHIDQS